MKITKQTNRIIVEDCADFNIIQTLNCGQIFRYTIDGNTAIVYSKDKCCKINFNSNKIEIVTNDVNYFYNFLLLFYYLVLIH